MLGTAITMAAVADVLGFALPGTALLPSGDPGQLQAAELASAAIVDAIARDNRPAALVTARALEDTARVVCAIGGSTNALVHLVAPGGVPLGVDRIRELAAETPLLVDVRPTGAGLLSDLAKAGAAVVPALDGSRPTALGTCWANVDTPGPNGFALHASGDPLADQGRDPARQPRPGRCGRQTAGRRRSAGAAARRRSCWTGVAGVNARIDADDLEVTADSVLVLRGSAPGALPASRRSATCRSPRSSLASS